MQLRSVSLASVSAVLLLSACGATSLEGVPSEDELGEAPSALDYQASERQFAGSFAPKNVPYGGFGGGKCVAVKTPVIFVSGNGDEARNFDYPPNVGGPSVYEAFRAAGYNDCELFGVNWLSASARQQPLLNYHTLTTAKIFADFVRDVLAYTGASQVDVIGHSMGSTVALHGATRFGLWPKVRKFLSISASLRGLGACLTLGYANPSTPTCNSQNLFSSDVFGLYPNGVGAPNPRMGEGGFRDSPSGKSTRFYSIRAGYRDEFLCSTVYFTAGCGDSAKFDEYANVASQLDVGYGSTALEFDYDLSDYSLRKAGGGDLDGVGHFRAKNNTGRIQVNMLDTNCTGTACCAGYSELCRN